MRNRVRVAAAATMLLMTSGAAQASVAINSPGIGISQVKKIQLSSDKGPYYWYREDGDKFALQYFIDPIENRATLIETATAGPHSSASMPPGYSSTRQLTYINCIVINEKNWKCSDNMAPEKEFLQMRSGELFWIYWGSIRKMKPQ